MKKVILGLGLVTVLVFVVTVGLSQHKKMFHSQKKLELRLGSWRKRLWGWMFL